MATMLERFRERKLGQWSVAYLAGAWVTLQVLGQVAQNFGWAPVIMRVVTVALAFGILPAVVLAWYHGERGEQRIGRVEMLILSLLLVTGSLLVWRVAVHTQADRRSTANAAPGNIPSKSVAVLPFALFTHDAESEAVAAGIHDEILTALSGIADLRLISRTSTQQYAGTHKNSREVARELGVRMLLEGSVQRSGNQIQVQAQLIDGDKDDHVWSQKFTGDLSDVFKIQSDIALRIATSMRVQLTEREKQRLDVAPTKNADAYNSYLSGGQYHSRPGSNVENLQNAARLYRRAIQLDPHFALAYARLSAALTSVYWFSPAGKRSPETLTEAQEAAEQAITISPDLPEGHMALGLSAYRGRLDFAGALREFTIAARGLPNDAALRAAIGATQRRQGRWTDAVVSYDLAAQLNPRSSNAWAELCATQMGVRRFDAASASCNRAIDLSPDDYGAATFLGMVELQRTGRLDAWRKLAYDSAYVHSRDPVLPYHRFLIAYFSRDPVEQSAVLAAAPATYSTQIEFIPRSLASAWFHEQRHESRAALAAFDSARAIADSAVAASPESPALHIALGYALAGLGRASDALREAREATALVPPEKDAVFGLTYMTRASQILGRAGFMKEAVDMLERVVALPGGPTPVMLRMDPGWDSFRREARFQALVKAGG